VSRRASKPCYGWQLGNRMALLPSAKRLSTAEKDAPAGATVGIWDDEAGRLTPVRVKGGRS